MSEMMTLEMMNVPLERPCRKRRKTDNQKLVEKPKATDVTCGAHTPRGAPVAASHLPVLLTLQQFLVLTGTH
jgi:hypothetical protein